MSANCPVLSLRCANEGETSRQLAMVLDDWTILNKATNGKENV